jgi:ring-1,2-phenylacetyl-CoA epoxidase subunit PaaD
MRTLATRSETAWQVLATVLDPEVPVLSVLDLGIVRDVREHADSIEVVLTPTYSGCPATEVIEQQIRAALQGAGLAPLQITWQRAPAWTTDWISEDGKRKLREYGIAPPGPAGDGAVPVRFITRAPKLNCPRCGSANTERLSAFGSTACKATYRCLDCREPFEHFKAI